MQIDSPEPVLLTSEALEADVPRHITEMDVMGFGTSDRKRHKHTRSVDMTDMELWKL